MKENKNVFIVFEERQLSCDRDYVKDNFIIIWDSEELGRNLTTCQLIEEIGKWDNNLYQKVINYVFQELSLEYRESDKDLDDNYFEEVYGFLEKEIGGGLFYRFYYQIVSFIKEVHQSEESAKMAVDYYTNNNSYRNKHYYVKYRLLEDKKHEG